MSEAVTIQAEIPAAEDITETVALKVETPTTEDEVTEAITLPEMPVEKEEVSEAITLQATIPQEEEAVSEEVTVEATVAPQFLQGLESQEVTEGETIHFQVKVSGTPRPEVTWWDLVALLCFSYPLNPAVLLTGKGGTNVLCGLD